MMKNTTFNKDLTRRLSFGLVFSLLAIALINNTIANELKDPTQLPTVSGMQPPQASHVSAKPSGPVLQSVLLSSEIRAAIISGKKINIGERFAGAKLIALTENSAILREKNGKKTTLTMNARIVDKNIQQKVSAKNNEKLKASPQKIVTNNRHFN